MLEITHDTPSKPKKRSKKMDQKAKAVIKEYEKEMAEYAAKMKKYEADMKLFKHQSKLCNIAMEKHVSVFCVKIFLQDMVVFDAEVSEKGYTELVAATAKHEIGEKTPRQPRKPDKPRLRVELGDSLPW